MKGKIEFWGYNSYDHKRYVAYCNKGTFIRTVVASNNTTTKSWILPRISRTGNSTDIQHATNNPEHLVETDASTGGNDGEILRVIPLEKNLEIQSSG